MWTLRHVVTWWKLKVAHIIVHALETYWQEHMENKPYLITVDLLKRNKLFYLRTLLLKLAAHWGLVWSCNYSKQTNTYLSNTIRSAITSACLIYVVIILKMFKFWVALLHWNIIYTYKSQCFKVFYVTFYLSNTNEQYK